MHDCRLQRGHFFVHMPTIRSFTCQRCRMRISTFMLASNPAPQPWRCIIEKCSYVACDPCAVYLHAELERIAQQREEDKEFDAEEAVRKAEEPPPEGERERANGNGRSRLEDDKNAAERVGSGEVIEVGDAEDDDFDVSHIVFTRRPYARSATLAASVQARAGSSQSQRRMLVQRARLPRTDIEGREGRS